MISETSTNPEESAGHPAPEAGQPAKQQTAARPELPPMIILRRPSRLSVLKNRPRAFQQEIINYLDCDWQTVKGHSLGATVEWLKTKGVETSISSVCEFRIWWEEAHQRGAEAAAEFERVRLTVPETGLSKDHIMKTSQALFEERAAKEQDDKLYVAMARLRQREEALGLQRAALQIRATVAQARVEIQERALDCRERMTNLAIWKASEEPAAPPPPGKSRVGNTAKIFALRKAMFKEIDELQASGEVVIPA
jgi:hypothetical protein